MPTAEAVAPPTVDAAAEQSFRFISHFRIEPSPLNPRKHFDAAKLAELAASIGNGVGIIEPLIVRPKGEDRYELIAGERRWRAADIVGLKQVPAIVRTLTDAQVLEMMVIENNQREDVNPLEEGDGFSRLLNSGYEIQRLAARLGRSTKYVYDRVKLLDLVPTAKELVLDGKLSAGHAILIARLKPEQQERVIQPDEEAAFTADRGMSEDEEEAAADSMDDEGRTTSYAAVKLRSVRELQKWIATHVRFDVEHFAKAAPLDFGEVAERVAVAAATPGRGKKVVAITFEHYVNPDARDESERTFGPASFKFADGKEHPTERWSGKVAVFPRCDHSILGVVAAGAEYYGTAFDICIARDKCEVHWGAEIRAKAKNQKLRESGQATKAAAREQADGARRRREREREDAARRRWQKFGPLLKKATLAAGAQVKAVQGALYAATLKAQRLPPSTKPADLAKALLEDALGAAFGSLYWHGHAPGMVAWAKLLGVDVAALESQVAKPAAPKPPAESKKNPTKSKAVQTSARGKKKR